MTLRTGRLRHLAGVAHAIGLTAGLLALAQAASQHDPGPLVPASHDGAPVVTGTQPHITPMTGGWPVRLHGTGFEGTTSVRFEYWDTTLDELVASADALDFEVVDGTLMTVVTPPMSIPEEVLVEVVVEDDEGVTPNPGDRPIYYTDATLAVTPDTGLSPGDEVDVDVVDYRLGAIGQTGMVNPLAAYLENIPEAPSPGWPSGPPPYVSLTQEYNDPDNDGDLSFTMEVPEEFRPHYDANSQCPPNQVTADHGLDQCFVVVTQVSLGSLEYYVDYDGNPVPADPTLTLGTTSAAGGVTVTLEGIYWNAAPLFGSDSEPDTPGETPVTVELCDVSLAACAPASADAAVEITRYFDNGPGVPSDRTPVEGVFTGATLAGSLTVPASPACAPDCVVRVAQGRFSPHTNAPVPGAFIEATAALTVDGGDGPSVELTVTPDPLSVVEPGGEVDFTVEVTNTGSDDVTLTELTDDLVGDLGGEGDCTTGGAIAPDATYSCTYTASVTGTEGQTVDNTVVATVEDDEGAEASTDATASVMITAPPSGTAIAVDVTAEPPEVPDGGSATFSVEVTNTGAETVTIDSLADDLEGGLSDQGVCADAAGTELAAGEVYDDCDFTVTFTGAPGQPFTDTATATASDDAGTPATASGQATVTIEGGESSIEVEASALPETQPEPGGPVTITATVTNTGAVPVTLTALSDSEAGDLTDAECPEVLATELAPGGTGSEGDSLTCSYDVDFTGAEGDQQAHTVTATAPGGVTASGGVTLALGEGPDIEVGLEADPLTVAAPGGPVTFTVTVANTADVPVTVTGLGHVIDGAAPVPVPTDGTCASGEELAAVGDTYTCTFEAEVSGGAGEEESHVVTATATADNGATVTEPSGPETISVVEPPALDLGVTVTAEPQSIEAGGTVTYTVAVTNDTAATVILDTLVDDTYGDLDGTGTCTTGGAIGAGQTDDCVFTRAVEGDGGDTVTNVVTATATNGATGTGSASVTLTGDGDGDSDGDGEGDLDLTLTAGPATMPEPGGEVDYTVTVTNTGDGEITLSGLTGTDDADLDGEGDCTTGEALAAGGTYTCIWTDDVTGDAGDAITTSVTATATTDASDAGATTTTTTTTTIGADTLAAVPRVGEVTVTASASAEVVLTDALPTITVTKTASPTSLAAPGGPFDFTVAVTNTSPEAVVLTGLDDDVHGDLAGQGDCALGGTTPAGEDYTCTYSQDFAGGASSAQTSTVTATATDNENNSVTNTASTKVSLTGGATPGGTGPGSGSSGSGSATGSGSSGSGSSGSGSSSSTGALPRTGFDPAEALRYALSLLVAGAVMVLAARRQRVLAAVAAGADAGPAPPAHHGPGAQLLPRSEPVTGERRRR